MIQDIAFWIFLIAMVAIYWLTPQAWRAFAISGGSALFIFFYDPLSGTFLCLMAAALYRLLPDISRRDKRAAWALLLLVAATAGPLIFFKLTGRYGGQQTDSSILRYAVPLGMSYYVFRMIHVAIDAYREGAFPQSVRAYCTYIFLFTIFVAGPIQRYDDEFRQSLASQFEKRFLAEGGLRIAKGLIKQTLLIQMIVGARNLAIGEPFFEQVSLSPNQLGAGTLWIVLVATYLTSYLNLSAYTDIAIGSSRLFGFRIMENFYFPIAARSLTDFWRRWHISLSSWCQDYVYAPVLGLSRNPYLALIASFQVMGLWHVLTLNRVGWGLFQAAGVIALFIFRSRFRKHKQALSESWTWAIVSWVMTQAFISLSFLFVLNENSNDLARSLHTLLRLLSFDML